MTDKEWNKRMKELNEEFKGIHDDLEEAGRQLNINRIAIPAMFIVSFVIAILIL